MIFIQVPQKIVAVSYLLFQICAHCCCNLVTKPDLAATILVIKNSPNTCFEIRFSKAETVIDGA